MLLRNVAIALLALSVVADASAAGGAYDLEIVPLKPDVYLIRRPDPLRQPVEGNVVVVVNDEDVVVFDGSGMPVAAENAIGLIRGVTDKPVRYLVNSHWHGDHHLGNQIYRREYPGVTIIAHPATRAALLGPPIAYVGRFEQDLGPVVSEWTALKERGELSERRARVLEDLKLLLADAKRVVVTPPDITVAEELVLHRDARDIHLIFLGKGNTEGDLVMWLPAERVVATGDLVVHPIPYGFGSFPREWIETLTRLKAFDFELLVPGHGEVQRDARYLDVLARMLTDLRGQAAAAVGEGLDLEATRARLDFSGFEDDFPQDELSRQLFKAWWASPIGRSLWLEASGQPIVQAGSGENR